MISREEKLRLKMLITDTVLLLCKNGLVPKLKGEFSIEGLIGISLQDEEDLMLVSFNERLKGSIENVPDPQNFTETDSEVDLQTTQAKRHKRRKRKHKKHDDGCNEDVSPAKSASLEYLDPITESSHTKMVDNNRSITSSPSPNALGPRLNNIQDAKNQRGESETHSVLENSQAEEEQNNDTEEVNPSKSSVKLESYDNNTDDELIMIKQEMAPHSVTSHLEMGPFVSGTQITGIIPNQSAFTNSDTPAAGRFQPIALDLDGSGEQVELVPGSGVYISQLGFQQIQYIDKGTKLVRRLVREVFPDVHVLANSSCKGRGTSGGLDQHKVEVIKEFVKQQFPSMTETILSDTMNHVCIESRRLIRARAARSKKGDPAAEQIQETFNLLS